jgi:hypothetical protein
MVDLSFAGANELRSFVQNHPAEGFEMKRAFNVGEAVYAQALVGALFVYMGLIMAYFSAMNIPGFFWRRDGQHVGCFTFESCA